MRARKVHIDAQEIGMKILINTVDGCCWRGSSFKNDDIFSCNYCGIWL